MIRCSYVEAFIRTFSGFQAVSGLSEQVEPFADQMPSDPGNPDNLWTHSEGGV